MNLFSNVLLVNNHSFDELSNALHLHLRQGLGILDHIVGIWRPEFHHFVGADRHLGDDIEMLESSGPDFYEGLDPVGDGQKTS